MTRTSSSRAFAALLALAAFALPRAAHADDDVPAPPPPVDPHKVLDDGAAPTDPSPPPTDPGIAAADADPVRQPAREETTEVRVIGSRADALQRVPGSGTVIGEKDLAHAQPVDTAEMLRRVPGVQVRQEYGGGNRIDISVRGLEGGRSRRVLLLEDGIPLAINPYSEPDMYVGPVIERYRAIEVVKGSGNILFGPQTLAGTINFVTLAPPESQRAAVDVDTGTYGYVRALANYGDRMGETRYVVQILHRRGDGFRDLPFDSTNALAKISLPTGQNGDLVLKVGYHRDDTASDDVGLTSAMYAADRRRATLSPASHQVLNRYDVSLTHEQRFSPSTKLKTLLYAYETDRIWRRQDYTRSPSSSDAYAAIAGDTTVPGGAVYFRNANTILDRQYGVIGLEPRAEHRASTGSVGHTIDFGGRLLRETASYRQGSGDYAETFAGSNDFSERHTGNAFAAYVQDRIAFREDVLVTPGIRYEHLSFDRVVTRRNVGATTRDVYEDGSKTVQGLIPGIGMVIGTRRINVFGGIHLGFAPPRVTSAISANGVSSDVGADQSINYELGVRTAPTKWWKIETTGFLSNFSNQVIVNTATTAGNDTNLTDAGATHLYGAESGTQFGIHKMFGWATEVELGARYTFSRAVFRYGPNAGNLLPYAPQHSANTNFDVEHPSGVGGQVAYSFTGPQFADAENTRAEDVTGRLGLLEARHLVDATVHYRNKPTGITLRLTAKNLLDTDYIVARRPEGIFAGGFRQVILGARWDWEGAKRE